MGKQSRLRAERRKFNSEDQARMEEFCQLYSAAAPEIIYREFDEKCCPNATRVLMEVGRSYGITVTPMVTRAMVMNAKQFELLRQHGGFPKDPDMANQWWTAGAYSVLVESTPDNNPGPEDNGFSGHIVGVVGRVLVDSSARQLSRPAWSMEVPDVALFQTPSDFLTGGQFTSTLPNGATCHYRAHPEVQRYKQLTGFSRHAGNMQVAHMVRQAMDKAGSLPKVPMRG